MPVAGEHAPSPVRPRTTPRRHCAAIAYQVLQQENPHTIEKVIAILEKHPWYANQWQARLQDVLLADHGLVLFMQEATWADDIRSNDKQQHRALGHYINWPFKPEGQPDSVQTRESAPVNILTAMAENERVVSNENDPERKAIALENRTGNSPTIPAKQVAINQSSGMPRLLR